jgi:hypothetical protein
MAPLEPSGPAVVYVDATIIAALESEKPGKTKQSQQTPGKLVLFLRLRSRIGINGVGRVLGGRGNGSESGQTSRRYH